MNNIDKSATLRIGDSSQRGALLGSFFDKCEAFDMTNRIETETAEPIGEVVDLFCGIGGISNGFKRAGFRIMAGYDVDESCRYAFETNNDSRFINKDVGSLSPDELKGRFSGTKPTVLVGCAPCQPFSTYKKGKVDGRWELLKTFATIATAVDADYVTMENVAGLMQYKSGSLFREFLEILFNKVLVLGANR